MPSIPTVHFGLAGLGNVGMGVYKNLLRNGDLVASRSGVRLDVRKIAIRNKDKHLAAGVQKN